MTTFADWLLIACGFCAGCVVTAFLVYAFRERLCAADAAALRVINARLRCEIDKAREMARQDREACDEAEKALEQWMEMEAAELRAIEKEDDDEPDNDPADARKRGESSE